MERLETPQSATPHVAAVDGRSAERGLAAGADGDRLRAVYGSVASTSRRLDVVLKQPSAWMWS
jgi:hypothetical protein